MALAMALVMVLAGAATLTGGAREAAATVPEVTARQAFLVDLSTDTVLLDKNGEQRMAPSSMTKMMTARLVYAALASHRLTLDTLLPVSARAAAMGGSRMFLKSGSMVRVEDLLRGLLVPSGNDAAVALAEGVAGSEAAFVEMMNTEAEALGMTRTHFADASGWPDPNHYTTAHDLALLAESLLQDYPQYYHYDSEARISWNGVVQANTNPLLQRDPGIDGIKTGHTEIGGYGLTASGERDGRRLVLVVNGLPSKLTRAEEPTRLLDWGWREFQTYHLLSAGAVVDQAPVWMGRDAQVPLVTAHEVAVTMPPDSRAGLHLVVRYQAPVAAPIHRGDVVGQLMIERPDAPVERVDLLAGATVPEAGTVQAIGKKLSWLVEGAP